MKEELMLTLWQYARSLGWAIVAALSFAFAMGLAIKVFDLLSPGIDEWEEIKKGNWGVALIIAALVLSVGMVLYKVI
ncbi:MAG: DUF350 domain-containing protein [Proteobacteria bacterium]|jgi:uncharacterized membrane protein YjfL (UPF0719 family)|nr:DUF350 domain-containing protein [Pseudomonadota bacterium]